MEDKTLRSIDLSPQKVSEINDWIRSAVGTLLRGRSYADFDDLIQEVWEVVLKKINNEGRLPEVIEDPQTGRQYIYGIAKNIVMNFSRSAVRGLSREAPRTQERPDDDDKYIDPIEQIEDRVSADQVDMTEMITSLYQTVKNSDLPNNEKDLRLKWLQFFIQASGLQDLGLDIGDGSSTACAQFLGFSRTSDYDYRKIKRDMEDLVADYFGRSADEIRAKVKKQRAIDRLIRQGVKRDEINI